MAVPKAKRSKQATTTYRSNKLIKILSKHLVEPKTRFNYIFNTLPEIQRVDAYLCTCKKNLLKKVCLNCYTRKFKGAYLKYIVKKKYTRKLKMFKYIGWNDYYL